MFILLRYKTLRLKNVKTRTAINAKFPVFDICVEAIIYVLLYNLHDCTFKDINSYKQKNDHHQSSSILYSVNVKFSRLMLTPCLTIDSFFALRRGSIKTSWLSKGLILLLELVIPLLHRADKQSRNFVLTTFCSSGRNRSPCTYKCKSLLLDYTYVGANS